MHKQIVYSDGERNMMRMNVAEEQGEGESGALPSDRESLSSRASVDACEPLISTAMPNCIGGRLFDCGK